MAQATATTLKDAEYPVFIGQPQNAFVEAGASDAVSFSTVVAKPAMEAPAFRPRSTCETPMESGGCSTRT